jgi:DNA topoisomerase IB
LGTCLDFALWQWTFTKYWHESKKSKQYRYNENWNKTKNQSPFYRSRNFAKALPKIRKQVDSNLCKKGLSSEKVVAFGGEVD